MIYLLAFFIKALILTVILVVVHYLLDRGLKDKLLPIVIRAFAAAVFLLLVMKAVDYYAALLLRMLIRV